jgi:hypothetical protein
LRLFAPLLEWRAQEGQRAKIEMVKAPRVVNSPRVSGEMDVTHMEQNANSQYATIVASNKKAPERCAKYGIRNQGTALSGWKQFTCAKFSYFFYSSMRPFTDYFPDYGGFTSRADCCALLLWWLLSP